MDNTENRFPGRRCGPRRNSPHIRGAGPASVLQANRVARGWTQRDVAERTGYSDRYVGYIETLTLPLPEWAAPFFAQAYGVPVAELRSWLRPVDTHTPAEAAA